MMMMIMGIFLYISLLRLINREWKKMHTINFSRSGAPTEGESGALRTLLGLPGVGGANDEDTPL